GVCPQPPRFVFAEPVTAPQQSYPVGAVVTYRCRPGYTRNGAESPDVTCLANSTWSEKPDFCIAKSCEQPDIKNGKFHTRTNLLLGATVTFSCDSGYRLVGPPSAQCIFRNGAAFWDRVPSCEVILCPQPPTIQNGYLLNGNEDFTFGLSVSYSCNEGFSLIGEVTIFCTMGSDFKGVWSGPAPECKVVKCENPDVRNGKRLSGFGTEHTYGDQVTFECNSGYSMKGSSSVTCEANSAWAPPLPTCEQILCGRPPQFPFATPASAVGDSSPFGTKLTYRCNPGYKEASGKSSVITCQSDKTWSAAEPEFCVRQECSPPKVDHGNVVGNEKNFSFGAVVTFTCDAPYKLKKSSAKCVASGSGVDWDPAAPYCESVCPQPPRFVFAEPVTAPQQSYPVGAVVTYRCRPGYTRNVAESPDVTCLASSTWSRKAPFCIGGS
ncbi:C4BPA protein, partial [Ptilonorhynchus violaceus]|nr:C4BPA protein [Ptilonorhynchus violaceus]